MKMRFRCVSQGSQEIDGKAVCSARLAPVQPAKDAQGRPLPLTGDNATVWERMPQGQIELSGMVEVAGDLFKRGHEYEIDITPV